MNRYELREKLTLIQNLRVGGYAARCALLAYAFLRGVPYRVVEPVTFEDTQQMPQTSRDFVRGVLAIGVRDAIPMELRDEHISKAGIELWLREPEADHRREARLKHQREAQAIAAKRREAHRLQRIAAARGAA